MRATGTRQTAAGFARRNGCAVLHLVAPLRVQPATRGRGGGERKSRSTWHDVRVSKAGLVKAIDRTLRTGDLVFLSGSLRYSEWTDGAHVRRKTAEIAVKASEHQLIFLSVAEREPSG